MNPTTDRPPPLRSRSRIFGFGIVIIFLVVAILMREPLRNAVLEWGLLRNDAPGEGSVSEVINQAKDREAEIRKFWDTGKIVHREIAIRQIAALMQSEKSVPARLQPWIAAAALDPDMNVRESALAILRDHKDPALASACLAQINDIDPQTRILGLDNFKSVDAAAGVPSIIPLLDDPDPLIVAKSLKLLEHWSGQSFGVKLYEVVPVENKDSGVLEYPPESRAKTRAAAGLARQWWDANKSAFASVRPQSLPAPPTPSSLVRIGDFALSTLEGSRVTLSSLRGKVVLLNFWTTWCTACVSEMPALSQLQKRHEGSLAVLGISLDAAPDEDGDAHDASPPGKDKPTLEQTRQNVARAVKARRIDYPISLDEKNEAGARCNGGELPTTVIIDAQGNVRRRFVGARSLATLEQMIEQASKPVL
jgi:thiol-disulfide isomerase/thioredoxin